MGTSGWIGILLGLLVIASPIVNCDDDGNYLVGVGIADVTGPAAELGMMGYASLGQNAMGIHTRLFARAYIVGEPNNENQRVVFVSSDIGMVDQAIKTKVVAELSRKGYGEIYTSQNVLLSGTHTHSGPGGYIQYVLYGITTLGFSRENFEAIVFGIVQSIDRAHKSLQPGKIFINKGNVEDANINRSPSAYENNPAEERALYDADVDKEMTLLKFVTAGGEPLGSVNWFAVHPTSMNNTNTLISGDNKGYAEMLFEYAMNPGARPGQGKFVAAFASSNLGDVSPNTKGPICIGSGNECDYETSTCEAFGANWTQTCIAFGPGTNGDMVESTEIIGRRQYDVAQQLFNSATEQLKGPIQYKHQYVNMTEYEFEVYNNATGLKETKRTCKGALGYSFAAGTTDGPGAFDFHQGDTEGSVFWDIVKQFIKKPSDEQVECQHPKPILLDVGEILLPYEWAPSVVETQILRIGNLFINGIPGELTTMSGRRLRNAVEDEVQTQGLEHSHQVIGGLSNVYTHYITTPEEYDVQRYEGASTIYGRNTLDAYLVQYRKLAKAMLTGDTIPEGPPPPNLLDKQFSLIPPILVDTSPLLSEFGDVLTQPANLVRPGETVVTTFVSGHPRNDAMREGSFFLVERQPEGSQRWTVVATDADWSTKFQWGRPKAISSESVATITWKTSESEIPGFYRIRHFGYYKPALQPAKPYQGSTAVFQIAPANAQLKSHPEWSAAPAPKRKITSLSKFWNALFRQKTQKSLLTGELSLRDLAPKQLENFM